MPNIICYEQCPESLEFYEVNENQFTIEDLKRFHGKFIGAVETDQQLEDDLLKAVETLAVSKKLEGPINLAGYGIMVHFGILL